MSSVLRVMIVDDEGPAREGLRLRLKREKDVAIVGEFGDARRALEAIRADAPDVIFLYIEMPGLDGFGFIENARDVSLPPVIFVTAHDSHAVKAFGVRALDYLLKPVEQERLHDALSRVREYWESAEKSALADRVRSAIGEPSAGSRTPRTAETMRIPVKHDGTIRLVSASDIDWIDAAGDSVRLHIGKSSHTIRKSMGEMLSLLDPARFVRIHRSTIVNVDRVTQLEPYFHGEYIVVLRDGRRLKMSRGYRDSLAHLMGSKH